MALAIVGLRYVVEGAEHILLDRPAVYCANHTSNVEPPLVFAALRRLVPKLAILYKAELRSLPILDIGVRPGRFHPGRPRQPRADVARAREGGRAAERRLLVLRLS